MPLSLINNGDSGLDARTKINAAIQAADNPGANAALAAALAAKLDAAGGTMTGSLVNSTNGAASTPALSLTGTPFTGGSATTTKPLALLETTGATSNEWSTSGTMLGLNAPSGFSGNLLDVQINGARRGRVTSSGAYILTDSGGRDYDISPYSVFGIKFGGTITATMAVATRDGNAVYFGRDTAIGWTTSANDATAHIYGSTFLAAQLFNRTSTPEGSQAAAPGSAAFVNNGGAGEFYIKTSGTGATGWTKVI